MDGQSLKKTISSHEWQPKFLYLVAGFFVATLLISNILAQKLFQVGPATFTAGILVFPISYIFGDVLTEVYGFKRARNVIYLGLAANVFMALAIWASVLLPPAKGWDLQEAYGLVLNQVPRIVLASIVGYVVGELLNSTIVSILKVKFAAKKLWIRTITSTVVGQFFDTGLFIVIAFYGVYDSGLLGAALISGWLFKVLYEALFTPVTYFFVAKIKRLEGVEHFDIDERRSLFGK